MCLIDKPYLGVFLMGKPNQKVKEIAPTISSSNRMMPHFNRPFNNLHPIQTDTASALASSLAASSLI